MGLISAWEAGVLGEGLHLNSSDSTLGDGTHFLYFEEGRRGKGRGRLDRKAGTEGQPGKKYTSLRWKRIGGRVQGLKKLEL